MRYSFEGEIGEVSFDSLKEGDVFFFKNLPFTLYMKIETVLTLNYEHHYNCVGLLSGTLIQVMPEKKVIKVDEVFVPRKDK